MGSNEKMDSFRPSLCQRLKYKADCGLEVTGPENVKGRHSSLCSPKRFWEIMRESMAGVNIQKVKFNEKEDPPLLHTDGLKASEIITCHYLIREGSEMVLQGPQNLPFPTQVPSQAPRAHHSLLRCPTKGSLNDYEPRTAQKLARLLILDQVYRGFKDVPTNEFISARLSDHYELLTSTHAF